MLLVIVAVVSRIMLYNLLKVAQWPLFSFKVILAMLPSLTSSLQRLNYSTLQNQQLQAKKRLPRGTLLRAE